MLSNVKNAVVTPASVLKPTHPILEERLIPLFRWREGQNEWENPIHIEPEWREQNRLDLQSLPYLEVAYNIAQGNCPGTIESLLSAPGISVNIIDNDSELPIDTKYVHRITAQFRDALTSLHIGEMNFSYSAQKQGVHEVKSIEIFPDNCPHGVFGEGFTMYIKPGLSQTEADFENTIWNHIYESMKSSIEKGEVTRWTQHYLDLVPITSTLHTQDESVLFVINPMAEADWIASFDEALEGVYLFQIAATLGLEEESITSPGSAQLELEVAKSSKADFERSFIRGNFDGQNFVPRGNYTQQMLFDFNRPEVRDTYNVFMKEMTGIFEKVDNCVKMVNLGDRVFENTDSVGLPFDFEKEKTNIAPWILTTASLAASQALYTEHGADMNIIYEKVRNCFTPWSKNKSFLVDDKGILRVSNRHSNTPYQNMIDDLDMALDSALILSHVAMIGSYFANTFRPNKKNQCLWEKDYLVHYNFAMKMMEKYDKTQGTNLKEKFENLMQYSIIGLSKF